LGNDLNTKFLLAKRMGFMNAAMSGAQLAIGVGLTLAITNGLWQRFSKDSVTLQQWVNSRVTGVTV
tara:strand:+ start:328 stop:525 length:198 start_codon:yes stop_codon:yes gene_type:complete